MAQPPPRPRDEERIDEAAAESFPASDAPAWTPTHAGSPVHHPSTLEHGHELRASLRADLERWMRASRGDPGQRRVALEEAMTRAILDTGRAVVRSPIDEALRVHNVETELIGAARQAPGVVVGARYDAGDPSGAVLVLAIIRALSSERLYRSVRFVAFAAAGGSESYVERLRRDGRGVHAMLSLVRLGLAPARGRGGLLFLSNLRSRAIARAARAAFIGSSRVPAIALSLPSWLPGIPSSDEVSFRRQGWPGLMVTERTHWRAGLDRPLVPLDVDRMAAAVPGLVAVLVRLAGGRG